MTIDPHPAHRLAAMGAAASAGLALAALALGVRRASRRGERRHPPSGAFLGIDGVRLHYVDRGSGPPLVLLHGMGSVLQDFATSVLDDLARDHRVIAFDRPGYGYSTRPRGETWTPERQARLFRAALDRLGIGHALIIGHSWGALIALAHAWLYPQETAGLMLLGGYLFPERRWATAAIAPLRAPVLGAVLRNTIVPLWLRLTMPRVLRDVVFAPNPVPARFRAGFPLDLCYRPAQIRTVAEEAAILRRAAAALAPHYGEIAAPVVAIAGEADRVLDAARHARSLRQAMPQVALRLLPETGHMIHHAAPAVLREAVAAIARQPDRLAMESASPGAPDAPRQ